MILSEESFTELVEQAVRELPDEFARFLGNVDFVVDSETVCNAAGEYRGMPFHGPAIVKIYKKQIDDGRTSDQIRDRIRDVVKHEVGHHFGMNDAQLNNKVTW